MAAVLGIGVAVAGAAFLVSFVSFYTQLFRLFSVLCISGESDMKIGSKKNQECHVQIEAMGCDRLADDECVYRAARESSRLGGTKAVLGQ